MSETPSIGPSPSEYDRLTGRDAEVYRVLSKEDLALAGLFRFLLRAMVEIERPGGIHMLGHAGRELSLGVLRYLASEGHSISDVDETGIKKREKHRTTIARALRLPLYHPSVTAWFEAHDALVGAAHYAKRRTSANSLQRDVMAAANALIALLWSRTGPFFGAKEDVERLLGIDVPTKDNIATLHAALSRPAVRWDFFKRLESPGWVEPLLKAGYFGHPPDVPPVDSDGRQRWEGWAEGEYLRRMAEKAPQSVRDALMGIPETLRNPYVWDTAAEAAKLMPADIAVTLLPLFLKALSVSLPWKLQGTLGELAIQLAEAGKLKSFALARSVLRVVEGKPAAPALLVGTSRHAAALYGLDDHEAAKLIPVLAVALSTVDATKAVKFLTHRLDEALRAEWSAPDQEPARDSQYWCPDLSQAEGDHGFKEHLAVSLAKLAAREAEKGEQDARRILDILANHHWRIYARIRLFVLANAGQNALDALRPTLLDLDLVNAEYPPREYSLLLSQQFQNVSPDDRRPLADAILAGPRTDEQIRESLTDDERETDDEDIRTHTVRWQRKRLRRFGNAVPFELRELEARLDADESVPKPKGSDLELEDRGWSGSVGSSGGPQSPLSDEELASLSTEALLEYLRDYKSVREHFESPTRAGLAVGLASRVRQDPSLGALLAPLLPGAAINPTYIGGVLQGLIGATEENREVDWASVLPMVVWVAAQHDGKESEPSDIDYGDANWRWAQREAAKLVGLAASKNLATSANVEALWSTVEAMISSEATWQESVDEIKSMDAALSASLNTVVGEVVEAFAEVALWNYRRTQKISSSNEKSFHELIEAAVQFSIVRFRAILDVVAARTGTTSFVARVRLGQYLPQLHLMDREGILARTTDLFNGSFAPPLTTPVWGGYITRQPLYNSVFKDLRSWYLLAAEALPEASEGTFLGEQKDSTWSTTRHLVSHCLVAVLRGIATVEEGTFVPLVFERSPVSDRAHAYREIFSDWRSSEEIVPDEMIERLIRFWSWRLDVLSTRSAAERKEEAGGLGWLLLVKAVSDDQIIPLFSRTVEYAKGHFPMEHSMWERLEQLAQLDVDTSFTALDRIVRAHLSGQHPHLNVSDIGPALQHALRAENQTVRQRAIDLVNLLGEMGFTEFGMLL